MTGSTHTVWHGIGHQPSLLIDIGIIVVLGGMHLIGWLSEDWRNTDPGNQAGEGLRAAATGGLTVVGILLPVNLLVVQLASANSTAARPVPAAAVVNLFVSSCWLLLSLVFGLYVLFVAVTRAYATSPLRRRDIGIVFGLQLILLIVGVERLVWGFASLAGSLI
ncbi:MAG TPA: hypothetical protein VJ851_04045 [Jatrophihabitans sp.]|nr:hypothetical protein [Jatrophihabitans sp.]